MFHRLTVCSFSGDMVEHLLRDDTPLETNNVNEIELSVATIKSKTQRSSSAVVSLDRAEVVVRKSKRISEARARSNESAATASQNRQLMSRNKPSTLSFNNKNNPQLSNTQESLIFHSRRAYRRVYAAHRKAAVDWDEDLRPSGESELSKGDELTPVSSPTSGKRSAFYKKPVMGQKGIREASSSAGNRRRPLAQSTGGAIKERGCISKAVSYDVSVNKAIEVPGYKRGLRNFENIGIRIEDHSSSSDSEHSVSGKCATDDGNLIEISAKGETSWLKIEEHRQHVPVPNLAVHSGDDHGDDAHAYVTDANAFGLSQTPPKPRLLGEKHIGRGQSIGGKLAAAFQLEEASSQCKRYHNHGHDAPPDHKSQSNPETATSSAPSIEVLPREKLLDESILSENDEDEDDHYMVPRSSDTDRLNLFIGQKRQDEVRETKQNNSQEVLGETEMISASIETVALGDGRWEIKAGADGFMSPTNSRQSRRHARPRYGNTPIIRSDHSSPISSSEAAKSKSCSGSDGPAPGPESSGIMRAAISHHSVPVFTKSLLPHDSQQAQEHTAEHQRTTPRKSIVDPNGSPRLLSHMENKLIISDGMVHCEGQSGQLTQDVKQSPARSIVDESGYDGSIEESFVEVSDARNTLATTTRGESYGVRIGDPFAQGPILPKSCEGQTRSVRRNLFRAASEPHRQHSRVEIASQGLYQSLSQGELASIDPPWDTAVTSSTHGKNLKETNGDTSLQALQRYTQSMLLDSSNKLRSKQSIVSWRHIADSATAYLISFSRHKKNE
ncbi:hypothetical protein BDV33DRAFT_232694 [Aspergillus novoparasiticus]|uniref:Uncharacterized protein n=1 Tax=Aspergillus novoparasiticus TaxID=986946 RepID=A0A5N6F7E8_9EURO|nr:hypothetical protein BDV33DRAFT_232694 [Aspergillus novoparasiticus]